MVFVRLVEESPPVTHLKRVVQTYMSLCGAANVPYSKLGFLDELRAVFVDFRYKVQHMRQPEYDCNQKVEGRVPVENPSVLQVNPHPIKSYQQVVKQQPIRIWYLETINHDEFGSMRRADCDRSKPA